MDRIYVDTQQEILSRWIGYLLYGTSNLEGYSTRRQSVTVEMLTGILTQ